MKKIIVLCIFIFACGNDNTCYNNYYKNLTNYSISPDKVTKKGIRIDTGGYNIDLEVIDSRIEKIWSCIQGVMIAHPTPQPEWQCIKNKFDVSVDTMHNCLVIKIVKPFYTNPKCNESNWQFIGYNELSSEGLYAPNELCQAKGLEPTKECPCMWRTAIQDENNIITPPDIYLWELGRLTSCNNVWHSPFAKCLSY